jgi:hypothetical protein
VAVDGVRVKMEGQQLRSQGLAVARDSRVMVEGPGVHLRGLGAVAWESRVMMEWRVVHSQGLAVPGDSRVMVEGSWTHLWGSGGAGIQ